MKNKKMTALLLLGLGITTAQAQQAATASGGDATGSGGSVAYAVGQIVYTTNTGTTGSVLQGVEIPYEITITLGIEEVGIKLLISAYPNPTTSYLILDIENSNAISNHSMAYQFYDISGKLIESNSVIANTTSINTERLPNAVYFLKVMQNNKEVKTFKIIKK